VISEKTQNLSCWYSHMMCLMTQRPDSTTTTKSNTISTITKSSCFSELTELTDHWNHDTPARIHAKSNWRLRDRQVPTAKLRSWLPTVSVNNLPVDNLWWSQVRKQPGSECSCWARDFIPKRSYTADSSRTSKEWHWGKKSVTIRIDTLMSCVPEILQLRHMPSDSR